VLLAAVTACTFASAQAQTTDGGSTQVAAQSGCKGRQKFNGMWRVRVTDVAWSPPDATHGDPAWIVTVQWGNGTTFPNLNTNQTGLRQMYLVFSNGDTMTEPGEDAGSGNLNGHNFPPSGQLTYQQMFTSRTLDENTKPAKLFIIFDPQGEPPTGNWWTMKTPAYNYRIGLTYPK
jgi:hypothetical protein